MLDYARAGDTLVVCAIDRLGRSVSEVTRTIAELGERRIMLRALREGIDTATPTGRAVAAIMATLAELELELGCERRAASRQSRRARQLPATKATEARPGATRPVTASRRNWRTGPRTRQSIRDRTSNGVPLPISALAWSERVAVKLQHHLQRRQRRYETARQPVTVRRAGERLGVEH